MNKLINYVMETVLKKIIFLIVVILIQLFVSFAFPQVKLQDIGVIFVTFLLLLCGGLQISLIGIWELSSGKYAKEINFFLICFSGGLQFFSFLILIPKDHVIFLLN